MIIHPPATAVTTQAVAAEKAATAETAASAMTATAAKSTDESFYVNVTDHTGEKRIIYASKYEDGGYWVYMDEYTDDPGSVMGYRSVAAEDTAFKRKDFDISQLRDIGYEDLIIKYQPKETLSAVSVSDIPEDDRAVIEGLFQGIEPVYVSDEEREMIEEEIDVKKLVEDGELVPNDSKKLHELMGYDEMRPIRSVSFADNGSMSYEYSSANHYEWTSYARIEYINKYGRTYGRITVSDFTPVKKLLEEKAPTPDELYKAYEQTTVSISDWFYADGSELYGYALNTVLRLPDNHFDKVNQYKSPKIMPSAGRLIPDDHDFVALGYVDTATPAEFTDTAELSNVFVMLPEGGKTTKSENMLMWTKDTMFLTIKHGAKGLGIFDKSGLAYGRYMVQSKVLDLSDGAKAQYETYSRDDVGYWYINLTVKIGSAEPYYLSFRSTEETLTDEFTDTVKYALGSLSLIEKKSFGTGAEHAAMTLSDTSGGYTDEGYKMVAAYSDLTDNSFTEYLPQPFFVFFYSVDGKDYVTNQEYTLERYEDKWYEVLPVAKVYRGYKEEKEIPFALGSDLNCAFGFDPNIYPLLPAGKYRLVIPFRERDSEVYHGGYYEFEVVPATEAPVQTATAEAVVEDDRIICRIDRKELFFTGDYIDIEYDDNNGWHSVRKTPVTSVNWRSHYTIDTVSVDEKTIYRQDYDLAEPGRYRLRIDICDEDGGDATVPETVYAYFGMNDK